METYVSPTTRTVTLLPSGGMLQARAGQTILEAATDAQLMLPHSCRTGTCGTCKVRLVDGRVEHGVHQPGALSEAEKEQGYVLTCRSVPLGPVSLECTPLELPGGMPMRRLVTRVQQLERLADDVMRIRLKLPANEALKYLPGQYINIVMNGGMRRSLSLANPPGKDGFLELHLRNYGGPFSSHVFGRLKENDLMRIEGPLGTFFIREESTKPMVFVASGTGFAPIKAIIESQASQSTARGMTLYWGGRRPADLYLDAMAKEWVDTLGLRYVPVVSEAMPGDGWTGRTGFVHRAVVEDHPDLSGFQVYACGAPVVVESARKEFTTSCRLPTDEFFADMFSPGAATAPATV